jgi:hypothetical protein
MTRTTTTLPFASSNEGFTESGTWTQTADGIVRAITSTGTATLTKSFDVATGGGVASVLVKRTSGTANGSVAILRNGSVIATSTLAAISPGGTLIGGTIPSNGTWSIQLRVIATSGNPALATVTLSDFSITNTGTELYHWEVIDGTMLSDFTFDADFSLRSRVPNLCETTSQSFAAELKWVTDGLTNEVDGITARMDVRKNLTANISWFIESIQAKPIPSESAKWLETTYGICEGGVDTISTGTELFRSTTAVDAGSIIRMYGMFCNEQGNIRDTYTGSGTVTFSEYIVGDMFISNGTTLLTSYNIELGASGPILPSISGDLYKLTGGTGSATADWTRYRYGLLTASIDIEDVPFISDMRVGDYLVASSSVTVTFPDGTITIAKGQFLECLSATHDEVASWAVVVDSYYGYADSINPLNDYFISVSSDVPTTAASTPGADFLTTSNVHRGSSDFASLTSIPWQAINGGYTELTFTGVTGSSRIINSIRVKLTNAFDVKRFTCYVPRPAIHWRPKRYDVPGILNLYTPSSSTAPVSIVGWVGTDPYDLDTYLGASSWSPYYTDQYESEIWQRKLYFHKVILHPDGTLPPGNEYIHIYGSISEYVARTRSQARPRTNWQTGSNNSMIFDFKYNSTNRSTTALPFDLAALIAGSFVPAANGGASSLAFPDVPGSDHFYAYPNETFTPTAWSNDHLGGDANRATGESRSITITRAF